MSASSPPTAPCSESGLTIRNSGLISGRSTAINLTSTDLTALNRFNNSGIIEVQPTFSTDNAIVCNGIIRLVNTGTIIGAMDLGDGNDRVDIRGGMITGEIELDDGINLQADLNGDGTADFPYRSLRCQHPDPHRLPALTRAATRQPQRENAPEKCKSPVGGLGIILAPNRETCGSFRNVLHHLVGVTLGQPPDRRLSTGFSPTCSPVARSGNWGH